jgi:NAD(P)-dependent dehydrogenase (short-subunit alcohol dehydrogenase family)
MSITADLSGKIILVTGASSGLGEHFARMLARSGAEVIAAARRVERLEALVGEIGKAGGAARAIALDVAEPASISEAIAAAGPIDVLVNNAGISIAKPVLDQTLEDWTSVVDVNLRGAFLAATEVARAMRERGRGGAIVNIASISGFRQVGHVTPYAISKAGVIQMTRQLALELARFDIRVNAIAPGYFVTDLNRDFLASEAGEMIRRRIPQRRFGKPEELDGALLLLCSDASTFMTGSIIAVDGGHLTSGL